MSVWLCIPSKRPQAEAQACVDKWRAMGYSVAFHRDIGDDLVDCDYLSYGEYQGYAKTTNALIKKVLAGDTACQWVVTGGDDTDPDPNKRAEEIAEECERHFSPEVLPYWKAHSMSGTTFGVMQPTGDRFAQGSIDRIAGSPWIGREFCERVNGGKGPYAEDYAHMFVDEFLQGLATALGVFWQRPDLVHLHRHFMRKDESLNSVAVARPVPPHLVEANSPRHWDRSKALFQKHKASGFREFFPV